MTNRLTHKILLAAGIGMGTLLAATGAQAQTTVTVNPWYNNITVGAPLTHGVYGQIVLGDSRVSPPVYYNDPRIITRTGYINQPVYLYVPDAHRKDWKRYCKDYKSCNRPVYFVNANSPRAKALKKNNGNAYGHYGKGKYYNGNANLDPRGQPVRLKDRDDDRRWHRDDDKRRWDRRDGERGHQGKGNNGKGNGKGRD
ncbi:MULTISPECIES: hypothetical protein [Brachymonas]|uniref:hypothetical protein n=1 Tax=Brachymonas TaxID=28219 RepID=UPI002E769730|nr:hypothetical protein [Brachymonas sp. J145]MEE1654285.1 hypothetical protein [Brachymonas sp. J145]